MSRFFIVLVFLLLGIGTTKAQNDNNDFPASSQGIAIAIKGDSIAAFGMFAAGDGPKETVLLLHGLPGNERNLDLAQALRRTGRNVIYFNYRGSWGSQGSFLYSNCIEDVTAVIDFFSTAENAARFNVNTDSFVLFGHSLGGSVALLSGALDSRVKRIGVLSPFNIISLSDEYLRGPLKSYIDEQFMLHVDSDRFVEELIVHRDSYNLVNFKKELSQKSLLFLDEDLRNRGWISQFEHAEYVLMETDHSFSDKRLELIDVVIAWLNK